MSQSIFVQSFFHDGERIAGIQYQSARQSDHYSLVLFAAQEDLVDGARSAEAELFSVGDPWIELVSHEQREVTVRDLEQWADEAPREIEWL